MSPPALPPFLPSFLRRLRFRPHCHSQQRAFVMMDATPLARSAIHFLTDSELSEKSIVRAFGGFAYCALFLLLPAAAAVVHFNVGCNEVQDGKCAAEPRGPILDIPGRVHIDGVDSSPHDDVDDDANISELCELQNVVQRGKVDVQRQ